MTARVRLPIRDLRAGNRVRLSRRCALVTLLAALAPVPADAGGAPPGPADLDQMLGTMVMMGFRGAGPRDESVRAVADQLAVGQIGGVILFEDNLDSPAAARALIASLKDGAKVSRPLIAVDQEGGLVSRLRPDKGFVGLPAARAIAAMTAAEAAQRYEATARELHELGINLNFAPVVDLDIDPANPIIGSLGRSFGADPTLVVERARILIEAHRRHHVLTALKHFPGHGSSVEDSHRSLPDITETWRETELKPFAALIASGYDDMIMVGHLVNRRLDASGRPASLSSGVVQTTLRKQLAFDGVVVSDDMQMGALRRSFPPDEAILLGIEAGVDLFVFSNREHPDPDMPARFHRVVKQAIADRRLTPFRIAASAQRIARLKQSLA